VEDYDVKLETKYFGDIVVSRLESAEIISVEYNGSNIDIYFFWTISADETNLKKCIEILDKYDEIYQNAKKIIISNFQHDKLLKNYIRDFFDNLEKQKAFEIFGVNNFEEINIEEFVEKIAYPDLLFSDELNFNVSFWVLRDAPFKPLTLEMDRNINFIAFNFTGVL
jgi:hypothetical protein